ncbi:hypothetical protein Tco_1384459 [Tanacetum coccineum]
MPFEEGRIPVKYLGVLLVPSRLVYRDCKELIEKVEARINDWKNKSLSIVGRLQLVQYVIASMHVFWASVFILPMRILLDIEQLMRSFLWCQGSMRNGKAKVAWNVVCLPKDEGGLGIRRLGFFNKALMSVHVWNLLTKKTSLWVQWVHLYKIKDRNFWDIPCRGNMTWGWRKILQLRPCIREFLWHKIGDGANTSIWFDRWCSLSPLANVVSPREANTSIWFDRWCSLSPLANVVSPRDRSRSGLNSTSMVANIMGSGLLEWPPDLGMKYPSLLAIPSPRLYQGIPDKLEWRTSLGVVKPFAVWFHLRDLAGLPSIQPSIDLIMDAITPTANRGTSKSVISKLVLAAAAYFVWQERNERLFKGLKRSFAQVIECVVSAVRLKLMSCRFKKSIAGLELMKRCVDLNSIDLIAW